MAGSNGPRRINATAGRRLGSSDVRAMAAGTRATGMNFGSNRPPSVASPARSWSGQGPSSRASTPKATSFFDQNRGLSNMGNSQFGNDSFGHSSLSYARNGSSVRHFGGSRFGGARQFELGATSFNNRETSFGGDDFSLVPDLFGLALNLGGFGLRGLGLLGSSLGGFGLQGLGLEGPGLLGSGLSGIGQDAGLESRQWGGPAQGPARSYIRTATAPAPSNPAQVQLPNLNLSDAGQRVQQPARTQTVTTRSGVFAAQ